MGLVSYWVLYPSRACLHRGKATHVDTPPGLYRSSVLSHSGVRWAIPDETSVKRLQNTFSAEEHTWCIQVWCS